MKTPRVFFLLALSFALAFSNRANGQAKWHELEISHFRIYFEKSDRLYAEELSTLLQLAYQDLSDKIGFKLTEPVNIFLAPSEEVFGNLTGNFVPHWGEGIADPVRSLIVLKSPSLSKNYQSFPNLIRHELTHVLVGQSIQYHQIIPRWFSEGIAIYFSGDEEFIGGGAISKALLTNSIIPLDEIDDVLRFHQTKARLAYEESYSFTAFVEKRFGAEGLVRLIHALGNSQSFDQTFLDVFGLDLFDLELEWNEFIGKQYRWRFLLDFGTFLWIFIPILFIIAFIAIKLRNRKTIKRWDDEERLANS